MPNNDWKRILEAEDRIIANSDRKHRYHFNSIEAMSEELVYQESMIRRPVNDPAECLPSDSFIDTLKNDKLESALRQLSPKQLQAIELGYWRGYTHREIAQAMGIKRSAVTRLMNRATAKIKESMG